MDYIKLVSAVQNEKGYSDTQMAEKTGINEYTYYNLKKYRLYLSKVGYYAISSVLGLPILSDEEIESILRENKEIVGIPETNLEIAAEYVNPEIVDKLEKELSRVKTALDNIENKNEVINIQYREIEKLKNELSSEWKDLNQKVQEAYSKGVKEGSEKVAIMRNSSTQHLIDMMNEEYTDKIDKLEKALSKSEQQYLGLYKLMQYYALTDLSIQNNLKSFEKPLLLQKEELGLVISDDTKMQVLNCYHNLGMSIGEIEVEMKLKYSQIEDIVLNYNIRNNDGKLELFTNK
jgi:hypothetical protein